MPARSYPGARRPRVLFRVIRYTRSVRGAEQMIRYVAFRSKDVADKEKGCFDRDHDHASIKPFVRELDDPFTRHPRTPTAFHCVFSLRRQEFDQLGLKDWRHVVRDAMGTYERETGRKLQWVAANHDNPTHPHCHVIIKAVYENNDGQQRLLRLEHRDLRKFREVADRQLDYLRTQQRAPDRAARLSPELERIGRLTGSLFDTLQQMIEAERRRREREDERQHQRWLWEERER